MKTYFLSFLSLLTVTSLSAQDITTLNATSQVQYRDIDKSFHFYEMNSWNFEALAESQSGNSYRYAFEIDGEKVEVDLYKEPVLTENHRIIVKGYLKEIPKGYTALEHSAEETTLRKDESMNYIGETAKGEEVRISMEEGFVFGQVVHEGRLHFFESARHFANTAKRNEVVHYTADEIVRDEHVSCGVKEIERKKEEMRPPEMQSGMPGGCLEVNYYLAHDVPMAEDFNFDPAGVANHAIAVTHLVNGDYATDFADQIAFRIDEQVIYLNYTEQHPDVTNAADIYEMLDAITNNAAAIFSDTNFDLAGIWTGRNLSGGVIGLAWVGATCASNRFHALENFSSNMQSLRVLTSHEIGHNFNCPHNYDIDSSCDPPGRDVLIMDPTANPNATGWSDGSQACAMNSIQTLDNYAAGISCLDPCPAELADFYASGTELCEGNSITYTDASIGTVTDWSWTFPGGTPSTSSDSTPTVTYNTAGTYDATLSINSGASSTTKTSYISVGAPRGISVCNISNGPIDSAGITSISLSDGGGTIYSNFSGTAVESGDFYSDYTCKDLPVLTTGSTYSMTVSLSTDLGEFYFVRVYADFDNSGTFESSEQIAETGFIYQSSTNFDFTVPSGATTGEYLRLRVVVMIEDGNGAPDACSDLPTSGEVEDYVITLSDGTPPVAEMSGCSNISLSSVSGNQFYAFSQGNGIVAELNPNGQDLGNVILKAQDLPSVQQTQDGIYYLPRNFAISASSLPTTNVTLRYYFLDSELDDYNTSNGSSATINDLMMTWYADANPANEDCDFSNNAGINGTHGTVSPTGTNYDVGAQSGFYLEFDIDHFTEFGSGEGAVLPLELLSFSGKSVDGEVHLQWEAAGNLKAHSHFLLEHSTDGIVFEEISSLRQKVSTPRESTYDFLHRSPSAGVNFYRLTAVDRDGATSESRILSISIDGAVTDFRVYPNPVIANRVQVLVPQKGDYTLEIRDINGKCLVQEQWQVDAPASVHTIQSNLSAGYYLLTLRSPEHSYAERVLLIN